MHGVDTSYIREARTGHTAYLKARRGNTAYLKSADRTHNILDRLVEDKHNTLKAGHTAYLTDTERKHGIT
jgi:hypothetical protein